MHVRVVEVVWYMIIYTSYQFSYCCGSNTAADGEWVILQRVVDMVRGYDYGGVVCWVEKRIYLRF